MCLTKENRNFAFATNAKLRVWLEQPDLSGEVNPCRADPPLLPITRLFEDVILKLGMVPNTVHIIVSKAKLTTGGRRWQSADSLLAYA